MIIKTTGLSLLDLHKQYGTGPSGFYASDPRWKNEAFAQEHPPAREYEIDFTKKHVNLNWEEQQKALGPDEKPVHVAVLSEAILSHYKATGERLLEDWYSRTSNVVADGNRVGLGDFDAAGLNVSSHGDVRHSVLGLSTARKFKSETGMLDTLVPLESLESHLEIVKALDRLTEAIDKIEKHVAKGTWPIKPKRKKK